MCYTHASHSYLIPIIIILPVWATRELEKKWKSPFQNLVWLPRSVTPESTVNLVQRSCMVLWWCMVGTEKLSSNSHLRNDLSSFWECYQQSASSSQPLWDFSSCRKLYNSRKKSFQNGPNTMTDCSKYKAQLLSPLLCHVNSRASYGVEYGFVGLHDLSLFSSLLFSSFHRYGFLITPNQYLACHTLFHHLLPQNLTCDRCIFKGISAHILF